MATVIWNQLAFPLDSTAWGPYNSNNISVTFNNGVATITNLTSGAGDNWAIRQNNGYGFSSTIGEIFYVSMMLNPSFNTTFVLELSGITDRDSPAFATPNVWTRYSKIAKQATDRDRTDARSFVEILWKTNIGDTEQVKSIYVVSLTKMYGAGNEPTAAEFERQCALNGIDLTKSQPRDTGTPRHWITTENKRLQTARSGNTVDSEDIAHFVTNCAMPLRSCKVEIEPSLEGYNSIELDYRGRNLLINIAPPGNSIVTLNSDGSMTINGTFSGSIWFHWNTSVNFAANSTTQYVQTRLLPNGKYYGGPDFYVDENHATNGYPRFSPDMSNYDGTNTRQGLMPSIDSDGCFVIDDTYKYNWYRIYQTAANTFSNYTIYPRCFLASETDRSWEPCNWRKFTVNFDNKIYGGTLDLVTGKLVADVGCVDLGTLSWAYTDYDRFYSRSINTIVELPSTVRSAWGLCSGLTVISDGRSFNDTPDNSIYLNTNGSILIHLSSANKDASAVPALLSGIYYAYKLATPITYQLTPQEITTLLGVNNVWCNDGKVTLQYYANSPTQDSTDMFERRRLAFVANSPHLQSAESGNTGYCDTIARFETNLTLPLKEATVTLSPVQGGSGDPSPTNVRAISGVDSIQVIKAGVNLLECDTFTNGTNQGITYTKTVNDSNQIESIQMTGTTTSGNVFRNLNYTGEFKLIEGMFDFYSYSTQVAVIPVHTNTHYNDISDKWASNFTTVDWDRYNITKQTSAWARLQVIPSSSNIEVNTTVYPMMCLPQDRGCNYEPFKGIKYNISFPSTIYSGTLDLITGTLTATYACITFDGSSDEQWNVETISAGTNFYIKVADADYEDSLGGTQICNMAVKRSTNAYAQGKFFISSSKNFNLAIGDLINITTASAFREWLTTHNVQLYYKLATPLTYQLTTPIIRTFRGVNNIWSNNGVMNIKYWAI